jgi:hypothetical protein
VKIRIAAVVLTRVPKVEKFHLASCISASGQVVQLVTNRVTKTIMVTSPLAPWVVCASGLVIMIMATPSSGVGVAPIPWITFPLAPWVVCASGLVIMITATTIPISGPAKKQWMPFAGSRAACILGVKTCAISLVAALANPHQLASALAGALTFGVALARIVFVDIQLQHCASVRSPHAACVCIAPVLFQQ